MALRQAAWLAGGLARQAGAALGTAAVAGPAASAAATAAAAGATTEPAWRRRAASSHAENTNTFLREVREE
jgi:hypothetical protein